MLAILSRAGTALTAISQRWIPSAFAIAVLLTFVTFAFAMAAGASARETLIAWGNGFWTLLPFAMQMSLVILTGYLVSTAPVVDRLFRRLAALPRSPRGAVVMMALVSMALAWVHWGLSIVGCAMFVRHLARAQARVDYRLLVAAAYFGMGATWHAGLSASAPLLVATPGHFLEDRIGLIPITRTIFHPFNLVLTVVVVVVLALLAFALHPRETEAVCIDADALDALGRFTPPSSPAARSPAAFIDHTWWLNGILGTAGVAWLVWYFNSHGFSLTLDVLNFGFLMLGILLHPSPASVLASAEQGASLLAGVVLQFPFYAGMYGVIQGTGLGERAGAWIAGAADPRAFPLLLYWYSGVVNYFVPSGGSKWAIEAPYLVEAAARLGLGIDQVVVAYAWGDMATDLIQPFWALPLLAAARLDFRDIMGYATVVFLVYATLVSVAFWILPLVW
ncbi:MAG: short-chain fatty acid transporter [Vicinamibacterales bacterium]